MIYAIISEDVANSADSRKSARAAHWARLHQLMDAGRLVLAVPHPAVDSNDPGAAGLTGSLVVAEFGSLNEAQAWADAEPYVSAGDYARVQVKPFKMVLP